MRATLLALAPPEHVERLLEGLRGELFRRHALVSALALPPLVPLGFLETERTAEVRAVLAGHRAAFPAQAGGFLEEEGALFLRLDTGGRWTALREAIGRTRPLLPGFLPVREGFFLACREPGGEGAADILAGTPPPSIGRFTFQAACLLRVQAGEEVPDMAAPWWRQVEWEEILRLPLRGGPAGR